VSQRSKIVVYSFIGLATVWVGWHIATWTVRGLASLVKHEQAVYAKWKLKRQLTKLEPWTSSTNYSPAGWKQLVETAKSFQKVTPKLASDALNEHLNRYSRKADQLAVEQGKVFLLLRVIFELPESVSAAQRLTFARWPQARSDTNANGTVNLSWPLSWQQGKPQLIAGREGSAGPNYSPAEEYAYLRYRFKYRDLSKISW